MWLLQQSWAGGVCNVVMLISTGKHGNMFPALSLVPALASSVLCCAQPPAGSQQRSNGQDSKSEWLTPLNIVSHTLIGHSWQCVLYNIRQQHNNILFLTSEYHHIWNPSSNFSGANNATSPQPPPCHVCIRISSVAMSCWMKYCDSEAVPYKVSRCCVVTLVTPDHLCYLRSVIKLQVYHCPHLLAAGGRHHQS